MNYKVYLIALALVEGMFILFYGIYFVTYGYPVDKLGIFFIIFSIVATALLAIIKNPNVPKYIARFNYIRGLIKDYTGGLMSLTELRSIYGGLAINVSRKSNRLKLFIQLYILDTLVYPEFNRNTSEYIRLYNERLF